MDRRQRLGQIAIALIGHDDRCAGLGDQEIRAGDADVGGEELFPQYGARLGEQSGRSRSRSRAAGSSSMGAAEVDLESAPWSHGSAGAMICEGVSWRSWMIYSPRSVSTGAMPCRLERVVEADLLGDHRLALGDALGAAAPCRCRGRSGAPPRRRRAPNAHGRPPPSPCAHRPRDRDRDGRAYGS